jgi:hypothetical protein
MFHLWIVNQRVGFTGRFFRHHAGAQTLTQTDDQVVDIGTGSGVGDMVEIGFPQFVRRVIRFADVARPGMKNDLLVLPKYALSIAIATLSSSSSDDAKISWASCTRKSTVADSTFSPRRPVRMLRAGLAAELCGDRTFQTLLPFNPVQRLLSFVARVDLLDLQVATLDNAEQTSFAVSNLNDLRVLARTGNKYSSGKMPRSIAISVSAWRRARV